MQGGINETLKPKEMGDSGMPKSVEYPYILLVVFNDGKGILRREVLGVTALHHINTPTYSF